MKIAIIGATGLVGRSLLDYLIDKKINYNKLYLSASYKSYNKIIRFNNKSYKILSVDEVIKKKPNIAFFLVKKKISIILTNKFIKNKIKIIDNSSAWRLNKNIKLIIPEINGNIININDKIISNPNCSTIQLAIVLNILNKINKIKRVIISTYQSVSGYGKKGINQLNNEIKKKSVKKVFKYKIFNNIIPYCGENTYKDYCEEEIKLILETKKILNNKKMYISATSARVPIYIGHCESVTIDFKEKPNIEYIKLKLSKSKNIIIKDNIKKLEFPMPIDSVNNDKIFIGRIRKDLFLKKTIHLWIVSNNIKRGASTNAVEIMNVMINKKLI